MHWVVDCPVCGAASERVYRCSECGADLAERPDGALDQRRVADDVVLEADLVDVAFPRACVECGLRHELPLDYSDVGRVIRVGCPRCGEVTRQRPVGADRYIRYRNIIEGPAAPAPAADTAEADA